MNTPTPKIVDDDDIQYVQTKRKKIVEDIIKDGKLPDDPKMIAIALHALDGIDRSALSRKKIKTDEKTGAGLANAAATIANLLQQVNASNFKNPDGVRTSAPTLGADVPAPTLVPGETEIGTFPVSTATFTDPT